MVSLAVAAETAAGGQRELLDLYAHVLSAQMSIFGRRQGAPRLEQITRAQLARGRFADDAGRFVIDEDGVAFGELRVRQRDLQRAARARLAAQQAAPMSLRVAASLAVTQTRGPREPLDADLYPAALERAAAALARLADIWHEGPGRRSLRIPGEQLAGGSFADGAVVFRAADGTSYSGLTMRRMDVIDAVFALKASHAEQVCNTPLHG